METKNNIIKCKFCQSEIDTDCDGSYITLAGDEICESCEQSSWEYPCQVIEVVGGESTKYYWCSEFGYRNAEYFEEAEVEAIPEFKYVKTDGWRGYWDVVLGDGYKSIASGWSTGYYDDVQYKHLFNDLCDQIMGGEVFPPVKVYFAFAPTSNVFSTSSDIIIREADEEAFIEWLSDEMGIEIEDVKRALS